MTIENHSLFDVPSFTTHHKNGDIKVEIWKTGLYLKHRENDLPAYIEYFKGRRIKAKTWYKENKRHRENNLPAHILFNSRGKIAAENYYINDLYHRLYGPAIINHKENYEWWYINGLNITDKVNSFIKEYNLPKWQEWNDNHKMLFKLKFGS